jgi:hypothetical protein
MKTQQNSQTNEVLPDVLHFVVDSVKELCALHLRRMDALLSVRIGRHCLAAATLLMCAVRLVRMRAETIHMFEVLPSAPQIGDWHVWFRSRERIGFRRNNQPDIETTHCKDPVSEKSAQYGRVDIREDPVSGKKTNPAVTSGKSKAGTWYVHTYVPFCVGVEGRDIAIQSRGMLSPDATANGHGS